MALTPELIAATLGSNTPHICIEVRSTSWNKEEITKNQLFTDAVWDMFIKTVESYSSKKPSGLKITAFSDNPDEIAVAFTIFELLDMRQKIERCRIFSNDPTKKQNWEAQIALIKEAIAIREQNCGF